MRKLALLPLLLVAANTRVLAADISIPLQLGAGYFQQQIIKQVFVDPGQTFTAWNDDSGCNHLVLSNPQVTTSSSGIALRMKGEGRVGSPAGGLCIPLIPWGGFIDVLMQPSPRATVVRLKIVDSKLSNVQGKADVGGTIWNWTKEYVHPQLSAIQIDFAKPLTELKTVTPALFPYADEQSVRRILNSLHISSVDTNQEGLFVTMSMAVTDNQSRTPDKPEPALSPTELAQLNESLKFWDVFITVVAKQAALATNNDNLREQLLSVLLNARHEILEVLAVERQQGQDPVRQLFLETWHQLAPLLRQISLTMPADSALDFVGFIGAVDALQAIDAVGPSLNLDISSDGLRRLARMITPGNIDNPLLYDERVDPDLRRLFDFGPPLELPKSDSPPPSGLNWLIKSAWAQDSWDRKTIFKLNQWIPTKENLHGYLMRVLWLLEDVVFKVLRDNPLEDSFQEIFHPLMLASAWQETCWRQFVEKDGERKPLKSSIGAVGIMQVSPRIWRGFYHPKALTWNINYNALAGGEILHHYLTHYAIRKQEHKRTNNIHDLARATYSAYNGGPSHLARYRHKDTPNRLKRIDQAFWHKYQLIRDGNSLAVKQCYS